MTFRYYSPSKGKNIWKSKNVDGFVVLDDRRSCKSNMFSVTFKDNGDGTEQYDVQANLDINVQLMYTMKRPSGAYGWKLGPGDQGGVSYFGENTRSPDGYVVHRFWPYTHTSGMIVVDGQGIEVTGQGMMVQAIQGMRPNLVAARWNFGNFQSTEHGGVSAVLMEFSTIGGYGKAKDSPRVPQTVTIGSIVYQGQLIAVVGATREAKLDGSAVSSQSDTRTVHHDCAHDSDTGYLVPQRIEFVLDGPAIVSDEPSKDKRVHANVSVPLGSPNAMNGLISKVDVLAEIPYFVRKIVNYVAGTKPYIYQTLNPGTLQLSLPAGMPGASDSPLEIHGIVFEEHTFISE